MRAIMVQGTSSGAGKTTIAAALCRILSDCGYTVAPFKAQNMSRYSHKTNSFEISRAQAVQAAAARTIPMPDMNPILLKPQGNNSSKVYLNGKYYKTMTAQQYYGRFALQKGLAAATSSLKNLAKQHDVIIIEGAGSPAEINLAKYDITNMRIASAARAPVLLVTDIDRGGSFASLYGTLALLPKVHAKMVAGFIYNKFRGDSKVLAPGISRLTRMTGVQSYGVIPYVRTGLPEEDSLGGPAGPAVAGRALESAISRLAKTVQKGISVRKIEGLLK